MKELLILPFLAVLANAEHTPALLTEPSTAGFPDTTQARAVMSSGTVEESSIHRQGGRNVIVQRLAPDPAKPIKPVRKGTPLGSREVSPRSGEPRNEPAPAQLLFITATVYDGPVSRIGWAYTFPDGNVREFSGYSNIDFNHLAAINTFQASDGEPHSFVLAVAEAERGMDKAKLQAPAFASGVPTFLPDQQDIPAEALVTVDSLHKLYALEKGKLTAAHIARERSAAARKAALIANPPRPKDLILRYRIAETPSVSETRSQTPEAK